MTGGSRRPPPPRWRRVPRGEQPRLADAIERHGLRTREAEAFLAAWRATPATRPTREALLRDPAQRHARPRRHRRLAAGSHGAGAPGALRRRPSAPSTSCDVDLTGFADPERRVLEACQRRLAAQVIQLARTRPGGDPAC